MRSAGFESAIPLLLYILIVGTTNLVKIPRQRHIEDGILNKIKSPL